MNNDSTAATRIRSSTAKEEVPAATNNIHRSSSSTARNNTTVGTSTHDTPSSLSPSIVVPEYSPYNGNTGNLVATSSATVESNSSVQQKASRQVRSRGQTNFHHAHVQKQNRVFPSTGTNAVLHQGEAHELAAPTQHDASSYDSSTDPHRRRHHQHRDDNSDENVDSDNAFLNGSIAGNMTSYIAHTHDFFPRGAGTGTGRAQRSNLAMSTSQLAEDFTDIFRALKQDAYALYSSHNFSMNHTAAACAGARQNRRGVLRRVLRFLQRAEGWLHAALVAVLAAASAGWISIGVKYLSDLRMGVCAGILWLDRSFCCGGQGAVNYDANSCAAEQSPEVHMENVDHAKWTAWSGVIGLQTGSPTAHILDFVCYLGISTSMAFIAAWLVDRFAKTAAGSGIPEVKTSLGGYWLPGVLSGWSLVIKCVGLTFATASGLALGKEGPLVHIACCWANILHHFSLRKRLDQHPADSDIRKREIVSAASSAGVSVAFGAPLGGVLFALEEVSSQFPPRTLWKCFFCAVVAALSLKSLDPEGSGRLTMFQMDYISLLGSWQPAQLVPFTLLGFVGGAVGALFIRLNASWFLLKSKLPAIAEHPVAEVATVAAISAAINYMVPMLRGSSSLLLEQLFGRCGMPGHSSADADPFHMCASEDEAEASYSDYSLSFGIFLEIVFVVIIRFTQTVFTFGCMVPAGIFIPSLTVGALLGRVTGLLMIKLNSVFEVVDCHKCIHPGVYALIGAASVLGGVTRMTISLVVIMFELTGGLNYIVPFMLSVMVAKWTADYFCPSGIYDTYIKIKRFPFLDAHGDYHETPFEGNASTYMEKNYPCVTLTGDTIDSLITKFGKASTSVIPLVVSDNDRTLLGAVRSSVAQKVVEQSLDRLGVTGNAVVGFGRYQRQVNETSYRKRRKRRRKNQETPIRKKEASKRVPIPGRRLVVETRYEYSNTLDASGDVPFSSSDSSGAGRLVKRSDTIWIRSVDNPEECTNITNAPLYSSSSALQPGGLTNNQPSGTTLVRRRPTIPYAGGPTEHSSSEELQPTTHAAPVVVDLSSIVEDISFEISPVVSVSQIHKVFHGLGVNHIFVTKNGRFVGIIHRDLFVKRLIARRRHSEVTYLPTGRVGRSLLRMFGVSRPVSYSTPSSFVESITFTPQLYL
eukprot:Lankesteria_metandrocarpae@DN991_c0_g1_i1.p1